MNFSKTIELLKAQQAQPPAPVAESTPSNLVDTNVTAGQYLNAQVRAIQGDTDARDLVAALQIATVSETEITASQNHINNIQNNSVL